MLPQLVHALLQRNAFHPDSQTMPIHRSLRRNRIKVNSSSVKKRFKGVFEQRRGLLFWEEPENDKSEGPG